MEKLNEQIKTYARAVNTLKEAVEMPFSVIVRDAAIQRFEYTFETMWKLLKQYLKEIEGLVCNSPKSCFRFAFQNGLIPFGDIETFLQMTDDRNSTSYTYIEAIADAIYRKLPAYLKRMELLLETIRDRQ
ncbi:MAG: nucleotidyltransferase [Candidatus Omnitrophota bacterium]|jgi:nucleotidyltransferase substrate binding protein (TIGR01987 family)|nr:MAG: nucleotidyltransferase [Candidatus Omnitrophota bacterium]